MYLVVTVAIKTITDYAKYPTKCLLLKWRSAVGKPIGAPHAGYTHFALTLKMV
jgi:hypothetical protein